MRLSLLLVGFLGVVGLSVDAAPAISSTKYNNPFTVESMLTRNQVKGGELDDATQKNLRILSFFEEELNKIFSCYIRLSCPRTRSPQVIRECQEIRDWPLYHQVMRMAGIRSYPYSNYATSTTPRTTPTPTILPTQVLENGLTLDENGDGNEIDTELSPTPTPVRVLGGRGPRMNRRRRGQSTGLE